MSNLGVRVYPPFIPRPPSNHFLLGQTENIKDATCCIKDSNIQHTQHIQINHLQLSIVGRGLTLGFLLVCSTRWSTYCSGRSSFCCDELTDAHLPADQQLHKRPIEGYRREERKGLTFGQTSYFNRSRRQIPVGFVWLSFSWDRRYDQNQKLERIESEKCKTDYEIRPKNRRILVALVWFGGHRVIVVRLVQWSISL